MKLLSLITVYKKIHPNRAGIMQVQYSATQRLSVSNNLSLERTMSKTKRKL